MQVASFLADISRRKWRILNTIQLLAQSASRSLTHLSGSPNSPAAIDSGSGFQPSTVREFRYGRPSGAAQLVASYGDRDHLARNAPAEIDYLKLGLGISAAGNSVRRLDDPTRKDRTSCRSRVLRHSVLCCLDSGSMMFLSAFAQSRLSKNSVPKPDCAQRFWSSCPCAASSRIFA